MKKLLSTRPLSLDFGLLLLRIIPFGFMAVNHGWGKFLKLTGDAPIKFFDFGGAVPPAFTLGLTTFAELLCAVLIVFGLFTRFATVPMLITMLVAAFGAHSDNPFKEGEMALLYGALALIIFFTGPGKYSVDKVIF